MTTLGRLLALLATCATAAPLHAQEAGRFPKLAELPGSTRAMALGGAYVMDAGAPDALFQHPALLRNASGLSVDVQRWGERGSGAAAAAATGWFGGRVGVGLGLRTLQYGGPGPGDGAAPAGQAHLFEPGVTPVSERIASLGLAGTLFDLSVGIAVDLVEERIGGVRAGAALVDIGLAREIGPVTAGVTVEDLGREILGPRDDLAPRSALVGVGGYGWEVGFLDVGAAAMARFTDDRVRFGGGVELGYWPLRGRTFVARVGAMRTEPEDDARPWTAGFSYRGDSLVLEWAFQPVRGAPEGGTHRFSVGWH